MMNDPRRESLFQAAVARLGRGLSDAVALSTRLKSAARRGHDALAPQSPLARLGRENSDELLVRVGYFTAPAARLPGLDKFEQGLMSRRARLTGTRRAQLERDIAELAEDVAKAVTKRHDVIREKGGLSRRAKLPLDLVKEWDEKFRDQIDAAGLRIAPRGPGTPGLLTGLVEEHYLGRLEHAQPAPSVDDANVDWRALELSTPTGRAEVLEATELAPGEYEVVEPGSTGVALSDDLDKLVVTRNELLALDTPSPWGDLPDIKDILDAAAARLEAGRSTVEAGRPELTAGQSSSVESPADVDATVEADGPELTAGESSSVESPVNVDAKLERASVEPERAIEVEPQSTEVPQSAPEGDIELGAEGAPK